ncbi:hypothetical protein [Stutzerimonas kirkiae]|uniref:hypothetical protein n=1 Tax=Stutzerimonas kirkiae TaxID=2211392 RepID=UPI0010384C98|nr:hypothetical protein [Stutzerimonas kirkiae]TBV16283.1 hypothetical protein DNK01_04820 [Stutzerimonas kirkiae]
MRALRNTLALLVLPVLAACGSNPYAPDRAPEPEDPVGRKREPVSIPAPVTPPVAAPRAPSIQKSHPRYAPPPQGNAHWDNDLGVYVLEGDVFYRERLYYRWRDGWYCAGRLDGPWEAVDMPSVPTGLRGRR